MHSGASLAGGIFSAATASLDYNDPKSLLEELQASIQAADHEAAASLIRDQLSIPLNMPSRSLTAANLLTELVYLGDANLDKEVFEAIKKDLTVIKRRGQNIGIRHRAKRLSNLIDRKLAREPLPENSQESYTSIIPAGFQWDSSVTDAFDNSRRRLVKVAGKDFHFDDSAIRSFRISIERAMRNTVPLFAEKLVLVDESGQELEIENRAVVAFRSTEGSLDRLYLISKPSIGEYESLSFNPISDDKTKLTYQHNGKEYQLKKMVIREVRTDLLDQSSKRGLDAETYKHPHSAS